LLLVDANITGQPPILSLLIDRDFKFASSFNPSDEYARDFPAEDFLVVIGAYDFTCPATCTPLLESHYFALGFSDFLVNMRRSSGRDEILDLLFHSKF